MSPKHSSDGRSSEGLWRCGSVSCAVDDEANRHALALPHSILTFRRAKASVPNDLRDRHRWMDARARINLRGEALARARPCRTPPEQTPPGTSRRDAVRPAHHAIGQAGHLKPPVLRALAPQRPLWLP